MVEPRWVVLSGHESGCPCFGCVVLNDVLTSEARASVALDHDDRAQTISLDEWNARGSNPEVE